MEGVKDRLGDLLEKLQLEGGTLSQDELLEHKERLMDEYISFKDICDHSYIDKIQGMLLLIDKLLNLE